MEDCELRIAAHEYSQEALSPMSSLVPDCLVQASKTAASRSFVDMGNDPTDWLSHPARMRSLQDSNTPRLYRLWADIRYNW